MIILQKNNLTELKLVQSQSCSDEDMKYDSLFYEQVLPLVINMLESYITIRLLEIRRIYFGADSSPPFNWKKLIQHFLQAIFLHPWNQNS